MAKKIKLLITHECGYVRLTLPEYIGMSESLDIEKEAAAEISRADGQVIIDLTVTNDLYSAGISLLIRLQKIAQKSGKALSIVNVSRKLRLLLESMKLDRVFPIFATDVEFDLSKDEIWKKKARGAKDGFVFVAQAEEGVYRLTFSGQMCSLQDLSLLSEFNPDDNIGTFVCNFESLDAVDSYGIQVFNDLIDRIQDSGRNCAVYGANRIILEIFKVFPTKSALAFYKTEEEAVKNAGN